jgi:fucose permease
MEGIGELWNYLAPFLSQCAPSHVLVLIVSNSVMLFLYRIHKKIPSGIVSIYYRILCGSFLPISFPPMFDMGERLKECEGDLFPVGEIMNIEITF